MHLYECDTFAVHSLGHLDHEKQARKDPVVPKAKLNSTMNKAPLLNAAVSSASPLLAVTHTASLKSDQDRNPASLYAVLPYRPDSKTRVGPSAKNVSSGSNDLFRLPSIEDDTGREEKGRGFVGKVGPEQKRPHPRVVKIGDLLDKSTTFGWCA